MTKKDAMFQFYIGARKVEDTGLITLEEGKELWRKYLPQFITEHKAENDPEMALWINCENDGNYHETLGWVNQDSVVHGNYVYEEKLVMV